MNAESPGGCPELTWPGPTWPEQTRFEPGQPNHILAQWLGAVLYWVIVFTIDSGIFHQLNISWGSRQSIWMRIKMFFSFRLAFSTLEINESDRLLTQFDAPQLCCFLQISKSFISGHKRNAEPKAPSSCEFNERLSNPTRDPTEALRLSTATAKNCCWTINKWK